MPQVHLTYVEFHGKQDLANLEVWKNILIHGIGASTVDGAWSKIDPIFVLTLDHVLHHNPGIQPTFDDSQNLIHRLHVLEYASSLLRYYLTTTFANRDDWMAPRLVCYKPHIPMVDQFHNARGTFRSSILQIQHRIYIQLVMKEYATSHRVVKLLVHQTTGFNPNIVALTLLCHLTVAIIVITSRQGRPDIKLSTLESLARGLSQTRMVVTENELTMDCRQLVLEYLDRPSVSEAEIDAVREIRKFAVVKAWSDLGGKTNETPSYENISSWTRSPYLRELLSEPIRLHNSSSILSDNNVYSQTAQTSIDYIM
ncbi:hypothetical protein CPB83DRAFT_897507 [Crepidotus variabilis]|uniref:Uncharacterized protein n=1 Tax=Crepidotus variabilis TaxID=179855 RepID=A0A9P6JL16_9AGAR|nr:hypothetical protein CPB83DRAFT_897507 [Crepidotus variabilis]